MENFYLKPKYEFFNKKKYKNKFKNDELNRRTLIFKIVLLKHSITTIRNIAIMYKAAVFYF